MTIVDRIRQHYRRGIQYHELMRLVFPEDEYPRAWNYQANGGPPGCAMAFGRGLRRAGLMRWRDKDGPDLVFKAKECDWLQRGVEGTNQQ